MFGIGVFTGAIISISVFILGYGLAALEIKNSNINKTKELEQEEK